MCTGNAVGVFTQRSESSRTACAHNWGRSIFMIGNNHKPNVELYAEWIFRNWDGTLGTIFIHVHVWPFIYICMAIQEDRNHKSVGLTVIVAFRKFLQPSPMSAISNHLLNLSHIQTVWSTKNKNKTQVRFVEAAQWSIASSFQENVNHCRLINVCLDIYLSGAQT